MKKKIVFCLICLAFFPAVFAQSSLVTPPAEESSSPPPKIIEFPTPADDQKTRDVLQTIITNSGWFPEVKIDVIQGLVLVEGKVIDELHLKWLIQTADRLPTVIGVVNKAEVIKASFTDMTPIYNGLRSLIIKIKRGLPPIIIALLMIGMFAFVGRAIFHGFRALWQRHIPNTFLAATVAKLTMLPVWGLFFYLTLLSIGLPRLATTIIGGTGLIGIVLGFAFKGIAENYLSGLLLAMRSPFTKGDLIKVNDQLGFVQNLNMRGTTIIDFDGNLILIPNTQVITSIVKNYSASPNTRTSFTVGVGYNDSIMTCQELIISALLEVKGITRDPQPLVVADGLGAATVNLKVFLWYNVNEINEVNVRSRAIIKTKEVLLANGISLPDDAREVVFTDPLKVQMMSSDQEVRQAQEDKNQEIKSKASKNLKETLHKTDQDQDQQKELLSIASHNSLPNMGPNDDLLKSQ